MGLRKKVGDTGAKKAGLSKGDHGSSSLRRGEGTGGPQGSDDVLAGLIGPWWSGLGRTPCSGPVSCPGDALRVIFAVIRM